MMFAEEVLLGCIGTTTDVSAVSDHTWFAESVSNVNYKVFATTDATSWLIFCIVILCLRIASEAAAAALKYSSRSSLGCWERSERISLGIL